MAMENGAVQSIDRRGCALARKQLGEVLFELTS
jgi:hypothetical protein